MTVTVVGPSRLHVGLVDLGFATRRLYGGAGFILSTPVSRVTAEKNRRDSIEGFDRLDQAAQIDVEAAIERLVQCEKRRNRHVQAVKLVCESFPPQHIGLGSKTAIVLATLRAAAFAKGLNLTQRELQALSGRGGVSGIGIHGFFTGGFLVDTGHQRTSPPQFLPSSCRTDFSIPLIATRLDVPTHWRFELIVPQGNRLAGEDEMELFQKATPIPGSEILETMGHIYHGIVPAVADESIDLLAESLNSIHRLGFKRREVDAQTEVVRRLYNRLKELRDCAVGMSSLGPLLFVVHDGSEEVANAVRDCCRHEAAEIIATTSGANTGSVLVKDDDCG